MWPCWFFPVDRLHSSALAHRVTEFPTIRCRIQMWPCLLFPLDRLHSSALAHTGASEQAAFQVTEFPTREVPQTDVALLVLSS
mmetsp:Transcript_7296/g.18374  ORF Transcript_7296/g.18374 Transcript_7296/m.18374 type:complete len:83 (-) Transcript_7296:116-364(-)